MEYHLIWKSKQNFFYPQLNTFLLSNYFLYFQPYSDTRMHSSRMRTVRSSSCLLGGGGGVGASCSWGCLLWGGVCSRGCLLLGGWWLLPGGCLLWVGVCLLQGDGCSKGGGGACSGGGVCSGGAACSRGVPATVGWHPSMHCGRPPCEQCHAMKQSMVFRYTSTRGFIPKKIQWRIHAG